MRDQVQTILKTEIVKVTPALAKDWLEQNVNFRKPHEITIERLARDMEAGKWDENGETIKFNAKDELVDGQHRLLACIKADKPFTTAVIYGLKSDLNVDTGRKRSLSDYLSYHYNTGGYSGSVAAALRYLSGLRKVALKGRQAENVTLRNKASRFSSNTELIQLFRKETDVVESVKLAHPCGALLPVGIFGALLVIFREKDKDMANKMAECLRESTNGLQKVALQITDPVAILREKLVSDKGAKYRMSHRQKAAITIIAWNNWRRGQVVKVLRFNESGPNAMEFPEIE